MARPLFTGIACTVTAQELLSSGHLAPLVRPIDAMATRINTDGIKTTSGDYNLDELARARAGEYLPAAASEACALAAERRSGLPSVPRWRTLETLVGLLRDQGIATGAGLRRDTRRSSAPDTSLTSAPGMRCP